MHKARKTMVQNKTKWWVKCKTVDHKSKPEGQKKQNHAQNKENEAAGSRAVVLKSQKARQASKAVAQKSKQ